MLWVTDHFRILPNPISQVGQLREMYIVFAMSWDEDLK